ncbi:MAG: anthranilate phosphoribosyltransferase [Actinobacteria bacterium]|nr:anthranilate phosphoribosyltransferase [Actinomycetota bacterium]
MAGPSAPHIQCSFAEILNRLAEKQDLTRAEAADASEQIVDGTAGDAAAAALLMGLRVKGETAAEIAGMIDAMGRLAVRVRTAEPAALLDIVGTGGDGLGTFNISTTAAFVAAGAGVKVAKHGNRAASSLCGSADVLEALGVRIDLGPDEVAASIGTVGIGFMLAPIYHPAAGRIAPIRRALGVRTVFNFLGPLTNPAGAGRQLVGVSSAEHLDALAGALACSGCERALVVRGHEGMDEVQAESSSADGRSGSTTNE